VDEAEFKDGILLDMGQVGHDGVVRLD
jgi:hypothetical protein